MNSNFKVLIASDCEYFLGILTTYFYFRSSNVSFEISSEENISIQTQEMNPNLLIIDFNLIAQLVNKNEWIPYKNFLNNHNVNACGLKRKNNIFIRECELSFFEQIFEEPLDLNEIDAYLLSKLGEKQPVILWKGGFERRGAERRSQERRSNHDRRSYNSKPSSRLLSIGPFQINERKKNISMHGKDIDLTPKEYELFRLFAQDTNRVFDANEIITFLWPESNRATRADLHQYIHLLRKKIEIDPKKPQWLITVKGFGYRLDIPKEESKFQVIIPLK